MLWSLSYQWRQVFLDANSLRNDAIVDALA